MPEQPRSIIAGTEADRADVVAATTAAAEAFDDLPRHHARAARRLPRGRRRRDRGRPGRDRRGRGRREQPARGPHLGRGRPHHRPAAHVRRRRTPRRPPRRPHRPGPARTASRSRAPTSVSATSPSGPVAVFGASNFPLAFSTAGGDTASALAAGCPVVVKGHPAHPRTGHSSPAPSPVPSRRPDLHAGTFSFLLAPDGQSGVELGQALVTDPRIKAVGFTGSRGGGLALVAAAAARPEPIPVYAEMSSINPVVVLPGALARATSPPLATAYVGSLTLGAGQFCTNPGLLFLPVARQGDAFLAAAGAAVADATGQPRCSRPASPRRTPPGPRPCARRGRPGRGARHAAGEHAPAPQLVEAAEPRGA